MIFVYLCDLNVVRGGTHSGSIKIRLGMRVPRPHSSRRMRLSPRSFVPNVSVVAMVLRRMNGSRVVVIGTIGSGSVVPVEEDRDLETIL